MITGDALQSAGIVSGGVCAYFEDESAKSSAFVYRRGADELAEPSVSVMAVVLAAVEVAPPDAVEPEPEPEPFAAASAFRPAAEDAVCESSATCDDDVLLVGAAVVVDAAAATDAVGCGLALRRDVLTVFHSSDIYSFCLFFDFCSFVCGE